MLGRSNPIKEQAYNEKVTKAADSFWSAFQMTENGKVKSTLLLYSFCLCWVYIAVYGALYAFLLGPLDALTAGLPVLARNLVEALVPTVIGAAVCSLTWFLSKTEKRLLPAAYLWVFLLMLACLITLLIKSKDSGQEVRLLLLQIFGMFVLPPLVVGGGSSIFLYYRYWKNKPPVAPAAELKKRQ